MIKTLERSSQHEHCIIYFSFFLCIFSIAGCLRNCLDILHGTIGHWRFISIGSEQNDSIAKT
jgi:type III secretory pathway component EscT